MEESDTAARSGQFTVFLVSAMFPTSVPAPVRVEKL